MKIKMYQWALWVFIVLMSGVFASGCKKKEEEPAPYDYRSEVIGTYIGIQTSYDTNFTTQEAHDTMWTDTIRVIAGGASDRIDIDGNQFNLNADYSFTSFYPNYNSSGNFYGATSGTVTITQTRGVSIHPVYISTRFTGTRQ